MSHLYKYNSRVFNDIYIFCYVLLNLLLQSMFNIIITLLHTGATQKYGQSLAILLVVLLLCS